jgi:enamine deaminase RidA (YjgF/YER057c/UK114 family)
MTALKRLAEMGIALPESNTPAANYVPYHTVGNILFTAGQTCKWNGKLQFAGKIGREFSVEQGQEAARLCGLNLIMQAKNACDGDLERIKKCVKLNIFLNCTDEFTDHATVANGVSDLMVAVFGEKGKHTRVTSGSNSLPGNSAVEVDAVFEIESGI